MKAPRNEPAWVALKDEDLLKMRICDLGLSVQDSALEERVSALYGELEGKGLKFRPRIYLGDEWFSPEGMVAISIPFFLAHPRLVSLEQKFMLEVEGGTPEWCQKLLRHEAGHCFDHAYRFSTRKTWQQLFGSPDQEYQPETYRPRPYSKSFVRHLDNWYAQSHPDEDFAETFAVWLTPGLDWSKDYHEWPTVVAKLNYVEKLAREATSKEIRASSGYLPFNACRMKTTLGKYYLKRRKEHPEDYPDFYDPDLRRIFNGTAAATRRGQSAAQFMKRYRKTIVNNVSFWTRGNKFTINNLVRKLISRCQSLDLRIGKSEVQTHLEVAAYLATLATHYLLTGKFKRTS